MNKLFTRQLAQAKREMGEVDLDVLATLVGAAYEEAERDRERTDRSLRLMADELEQVHTPRTQELRTADQASISVRIDITDLKRSEESFRALFEDNPIPMLVWVGDGPENARFVSVNPAALAHYGYTREQFAAMTVMDLRPPEDRDIFRKFLSTG